MLKISFIGCSWTHGHNLSYTNTYPYIVHEKLNKSNIENQVINAGREGASWVNYPDTLEYIHNKYNPDVYVVQHTTPDRGMLLWNTIKDKHQRITRDHDVYDNYIQLWDNSQCYYHLTVGMAERLIANEKSELIEHMFNEIQRKSNLKPGNIIERVRYWLEHERLHPLTFKQYKQTVDYCDMYVRRMNRKIIHVFWLNDSFVVDVPTNQIVVQSELKDFDQLIVDNGYHFDQRGNTAVADILIKHLI